MAKPHLIFHIGMHKTGTTLLQGYFEKYRKELFERGVYFNSANYFMGMDLMKGSPLPPSKIMEWQNKIAQQIQVHGQKTFLISSETFSGSPRVSYQNTHAVVRDLKKIIGDARISILVSTRRQDTFIESWYHQMVKQGSTQLFHEFLQTIHPELFQWNSILDLYCSSFEDCFVKVIPYEIALNSPENFIQNYMEAISPGWNLSTRVDQVSNPSLSKKGVELQRISNGILDPAEQKKLRLFLQAEFSKKTSENFDLFTEEQRIALLRSLREHNTTLFVKYCSEVNPQVRNYYLAS